MEKVKRNGMVAVLYSPDYGAGWFTWNSDVEECIFHPEIVKMVEENRQAEITNEFYNYIDFFTPNETEAEFYTGIKIANEQDAKKAANKLIKLGIKKAIITLGEKGLYYSDGKENIYLKASRVKAVDTTGAGDAFNGGLAYGLSKGKTINECLELANKVAGLSTTKLGAGNAMPFLKDIKIL